MYGTFDKSFDMCTDFAPDLMIKTVTMNDNYSASKGVTIASSYNYINPGATL